MDPRPFVYILSFDLSSLIYSAVTALDASRSQHNYQITNRLSVPISVYDVEKSVQWVAVAWRTSIWYRYVQGRFSSSLRPQGNSVLSRLLKKGHCRRYQAELFTSMRCRSQENMLTFFPRLQTCSHITHCHIFLCSPVFTHAIIQLMPIVYFISEVQVSNPGLENNYSAFSFLVSGPLHEGRFWDSVSN